MQINAPCKYEWSDVFEFGIQKYGSKWPACSAYYFDSGKKYDVNPVLLALWAIIRSQGFTSKEYRENLDIYRIGGRYKSYGDAIATGASELAKFSDTSMMQEQVEIEKLYAEFEAWISKLPPAVEPPPPPRPPEPPKPQKPTEPPPAIEQPGDSSPSDWKKTAKKIAAWAGGLCSIATIAVALTPTPIDDIVVRVVKFIVEVLGGL